MSAAQHSLVLLLAFALAVLLVASSSSADTRNWDGDTFISWGAGGKCDAAPLNSLTSDIANFNLAAYGGSDYAPNAGTASLNGITIGAAQNWTNNGAGTFTGGANTLSFNGFMNAGSSGPLTRSGGASTGDILISSTGELVITANTQNKTISAAIGGTGRLAYSGAGSSLSLSGTNFYDGGTVINLGALGVSANAHLGNASGGTPLNGGRLDGVMNAARSVTANGTGSSISVSRISNITISGALTGSGAITFVDGGGAGNGSQYYFASSSDNFTVAMSLEMSLADVDDRINILGDTSSVAMLLADLDARIKALDESLGDASDNIIFTATGGAFSLNSTEATFGLTFNNRAIELSNSSATVSNINATHALTIGSNLVATGAGAMTLTLDAAAGPSNVFSGNITDGTGGGRVSVTKTGAGIWSLSGTNSYTGVTTVNGGILNLGSSLALQNSVLDTTHSVTGTGSTGLRTTQTALTIGGLSGNKNFASMGGVFSTTSGGYGNVTDLTLNLVGNASYSGNISNGAANMNLIKTGVGTQTLTGANTYTGRTTISSGTLLLNRSAANNTTILTDGNTATTSDILINGGTLQITASEQIANNGSINMSSGFFNFGTATGLTETIDKFTNSGGVFSTGANTLIGLGATVTWSGGTNTINPGGTVRDKHVVITGGVNTVEADGTLDLQNGGGTSGLFFGGTAGPTVTLNSVAIGTAGRLLLSQNVTVDNSLTTGTAQILSGGNNAIAGFIDMEGGSRTFTINDGSATIDMLISAAITNGGLIKDGLGTLALSAVNTYAGATTITAGTLQIGSGSTTGRLTATTSITNNGNLTINRSDAFNQATDLGAGVAITGSGSFTQAGTGTTTLTAVNTYTGATTVSGGTLIVNGNISASSLTTVGVNGTLSGTGTVGEAIINGMLAVGVGSNPGQMDFTDTLGLNGEMITEIDGTMGAGVTGGHDFVNLTGAGAAGVLTYGGNMALDIGVIFTVGTYSWNLFDMASKTGTFDTITLADQYSGSLLDTDLNGVWELTSGNHTWQFTESSGILGLIVIPEPSVALLGAIGGLLLLRRRR